MEDVPGHDPRYPTVHNTVYKPKTADPPGEPVAPSKTTKFIGIPTERNGAPYFEPALMRQVTDPMTDEQLAELGLMRIFRLPAIDLSKEVIEHYLRLSVGAAQDDPPRCPKCKAALAGFYCTCGWRKSIFGNCSDCGSYMLVSGCSQQCKKLSKDLPAGTEPCSDPKPDLPRGGFF